MIKFANKNKSADIKIDGKGDLFLYSRRDNNTIKLTNVVKANDLSENLISLSKFVDTGLGIYLDNKILKIFDKKTHDVYLSGQYYKPNWIINLNVESLNRKKITRKLNTITILVKLE